MRTDWREWLLIQRGLLACVIPLLAAVIHDDDEEIAWVRERIEALHHRWALISPRHQRGS